MKAVFIFNTVIISNLVKHFSYYKTILLPYISLMTFIYISSNCGEETETVDISNYNDTGKGICVQEWLSMKCNYHDKHHIRKL
jgi:hypothetical protein